MKPHFGNPAFLEFRNEVRTGRDADLRYKTISYSVLYVWNGLSKGDNPWPIMSDEHPCCRRLVAASIKCRIDSDRTIGLVIRATGE